MLQKHMPEETTVSSSTLLMNNAVITQEQRIKRAVPTELTAEPKTPNSG